MTDQLTKLDEEDCRVKRTAIVWIVDSLCGVLLLAITVWVACRYGALPDRIPIHYGADGVIDVYGQKSTIWSLVASAWIMVGVMTAVEQFPRLWNVPVKVTKENRRRLLTLTWHLVSTTKLIVFGLFVYLMIMAVHGGNLWACFVPATMTVLSVNSIYWIVRIFLNRKVP